MNYQFSILSVLVVSLATSSLFGGVYPHMDVADRTKEADKVVIGQAKKITPRWATNSYGDQLIISQIEFTVEETLKGTPEATTTMDLEGGTLDGLTLDVSDMPKFKVGDKAVLFLDRIDSKTHKPLRRGLGIMKLDKENRAEDGQSLEDIRGKVRGNSK
jgi:hypothetical protein